MAYREVRVDDSIKKFICDSIADVQMLPINCISGSMATVASSSAVFYMTNSRGWQPHQAPEVYGLAVPNDALAVEVGIGGVHVQVINPLVVRMSNGTTWEVLS